MLSTVYQFHHYTLHSPPEPRLLRTAYSCFGDADQFGETLSMTQLVVDFTLNNESIKFQISLFLYGIVLIVSNIENSENILAD